MFAASVSLPMFGRKGRPQQNPKLVAYVFCHVAAALVPNAGKEPSKIYIFGYLEPVKNFFGRQPHIFLCSQHVTSVWPQGSPTAKPSACCSLLR